MSLPGHFPAGGVEILYFETLLTQVFEIPDGKNRVVDGVLREVRTQDPELKGSIRAFLQSMPPELLTRGLLAGLTKEEVEPFGGPVRLSTYIKESYPFYLDPIPNLYFSRDYGSVIGNRISVNSMKSQARRRESMLLQAIVDYHPRFDGAGAEPWHRWDEVDIIEGGDILVLSPKVVVIGCSARTSPEGIEELALRILHSDQGFREVLVFQIPFTRAYMHLDTVFTMVDYDTFTIYPGVEDRISIYRLTLGSGNGLAIVPETNLEKTLSKSLGLPGVRWVPTGAGHALTAQREQWNDGTNTLAVAPGVVITYRRNRVSNDQLRRKGIEVLEIPGSELVRGRGGPRCMSMPIVRS